MLATSLDNRHQHISLHRTDIPAHTPLVMATLSLPSLRLHRDTCTAILLMHHIISLHLLQCTLVLHILFPLIMGPLPLQFQVILISHHLLWALYPPEYQHHIMATHLDPITKEYHQLGHLQKDLIPRALYNPFLLSLMSLHQWKKSVHLKFKAHQQVAKTSIKGYKCSRKTPQRESSKKRFH